MSTVSVARKRNQATLSPLMLASLVILVGFGVYFVLMLIAAVGFDLTHRGRIYPGVWMAGVNLSGLSLPEAEIMIAQQLSYPETGKLVLQDGQQVWIARPAELGLTLDAAASAQAAYQLGRQGGPLRRIVDTFGTWYAGRNVAPLLVYDERQARAYLENIAAKIDQPTIEASLQINGTDVVELPGQTGRQVDISHTLSLLSGQMRSLTDGMIQLKVVEKPPMILDASQAAQQARVILSAPLILNIPDASEGDPGPWTIEPQQLGELIAIERVETPDGAQFQVGLKNAPLRRFLDEQATQLARQPENARFIFNDETRQLEVLQASVTGRALNVPVSLEAIRTSLLQGEHNVALSFDYTPPSVSSDATAEQLGITELVSSHTSYFRGSSRERIQNIEAAASKFHGLLVPPGAVFSMADAMGDVSLDNGFAEALIIFGGRTIKGVGGGVCQVSTTLFRTAFLGGYPIVERNPHAYRVGYYEQTAQGWDSNLAGLDATVFVPQVDLKFKNDTDSWLLMETYVNDKAGRITWKFYSTSDGREVTWETTGPQNVVPPPDPVYEENPDLAPGEIKQVDWAAEGADVIVTRWVRRAGELLFKDQIITHYEPWRDVYQYGPGTDIPKN